jgi:hypothetical protein
LVVKVIDVVAAVAAQVPLETASVPLAQPRLFEAPAADGRKGMRQSRTAAITTVLLARRWELLMQYPGVY